MVIPFILFNCMSLLLPYEDEISIRTKTNIFFEKCTIQRKTQAESELRVQGRSINDEFIDLTYVLTENCGFTTPPKTRELSKTEMRLYGKIPHYFFRLPNWKNMCKTYW
jgi:hypothetical protein